jgi:uncharacterized protein
MKKALFVSIVLILALAAYFLVPARSDNLVKPYQDTDSQLLIPQRNVVIVTIDLKSSDRNFFTEETISLLEKLNQDLIEIKGVTQVDSILNANTVRSDEYEIFINPIIAPKVERTVDYYTGLPHQIVKYPELKPYINESMESLLFYIYFGYKVSPMAIDKALTVVQDTYTEFSLEYTGMSPIIAKTEQLLTADIVIFLPVLLILIMLVFLSFKNIKAIISAWILIIIAVFASYSFIRFAGVEDSPLLLLVPVFSLGLLSDYIIHYYYHLFYAPGSHEVFSVRKRMLFPLSMTAISTLTGFISLLFINGSGHLLLGTLISASVIITFMGVFLWFPYLKFKTPSRNILPRFQTLQVRFFSLIVKVRWVIYLLLLALLVWGLFLLPNLKIEPYPIEQLPAGNTIKKADRVINGEFYGNIPYFIEIDTGEEGAVLTREALLVLDDLHTLLDTSDVVGYSHSMLTILKQLSFYFEGDKDMLLKSEDMMGSFIIEQYMLYYSSSVDPLEYESLINAAYSVFSVKGLLYYQNVDSLTEFYNLINQIDTTLPEGWSIQVHGMINELQTEERILKRNWIYSFAIGSFMIFIMVLIFYKKLLMALLSLIPGILSMIFSFGIISLAGISIDAFSIIFVAIIIGLVIDYSIHTLGAIESLKNITTVEEGFAYIINYSGKPIFLSFLTSIFSFSVLFLSSFTGARTLGLLLVSSLLISFFLSVYLLPVIILPNRIKREKSNKKDLI